MNILALDTATSACSAALWRDGMVLAHRFAIMPRGQSEALLPMVRDVMRQSGCGFPDLGLIAVTVGPGAFTGLRIGLAAARGMALASGVGCLGLTTLEAVAHGVPGAERDGVPILVALESKRADIYAQVFSADLAPLGSPQALLPEDLARVVPPGTVRVVGDAAERTAAVLAASGVDAVPSTAIGVPDAATIAGLAADRADQATGMPRPLYLRPPDVRVPATARRR
jgi:tRNA threonylcarbamoyladenosine biosynthesis protein TsaB